MNYAERFRAVMNFQPADRLPCWECPCGGARQSPAGLPQNLADVFEISQYFRLDPYRQFWFSTTESTIEAVRHHVEGVAGNMDDHPVLRPKIFPSHDRAIEG